MCRASPVVFSLAVLLVISGGLVVRGCGVPLGTGWVRGIDVSHHQGEVDWAAVAVEGIDFVWIKSTEGGDWTDPRFEENWLGAGEAGLRRGAYHFFTFCRPGAEQATHYLEVVPEEEAELPPVVDVEYGGNCSRRPSTEVLSVELRAFMDLVGAADGRRPLVYVTGELFRDHTLLLEGERLWVRSIYRAPTREVPVPAAVWQYSNLGSLQGVTGRVDLNVYRRGEEP